jgi:hypothetical protein
MRDVLEIAALVAGYLVLTRWVLPKLGVPT